MGGLLSYSIASGIVLACLYLAYRLTMSNERQFTLNRVTLYLIYIVSFLSVAGYDWIGRLSRSAAPVAATVIDIDLAGISSGVVEESQPLWLSIVLAVYAFGICVAAARFLWSLAKIAGIIRKGKVVADYEGYRLIVVADNKVAPFSCMGYMVISEKDYNSGKESIITHELTHLHGHHWIDLMIANVIAIFQWFNPAAWLMIEEFKTVHEYEADDSVIRSGADITQYQYLLIEKAVGERLPSPANSLNHSKLKKRVTMMYKSKPRTMRRMASLAILPALLAGVAIVNSSAVASVISDTENASMFPQELAVVNAPVAVETAIVDDSADKVTNFSADSEISAVENESVAPMATPAPDPMPVTVESTVEVTSASVAAPVAAAPVEAYAAAPEKEEVYVAVDKNAEYPGGQMELMNFLMRNVRYPENAQKNNIQGRVVVRFVVGKDGKISDVKVVKGVDPELDAESVRVLSTMPDWIPAECNGKPVASYFNLPVSFKLHDFTPNDSTANKK